MEGGVTGGRGFALHRLREGEDFPLSLAAAKLRDRDGSFLSQPRESGGFFQKSPLYQTA